MILTNLKYFDIEFYLIIINDFMITFIITNHPSPQRWLEMIFPIHSYLNPLINVVVLALTRISDFIFENL